MSEIMNYTTLTTTNPLDVVLPQGLKHRFFDRLKAHARKWMKELSSMMWDMRTTLSRATR
jgi:hypothetical protein